MKSSTLKIGLAAMLALFIGFSTTAQAAVPELSENMTQGQFAVWLVHAVGAASKLPAAPTEQDAIDFLKKLNVQPSDGWQKDEVITKKFLASILGDESLEGLSFDELIARIRAFVEGRFSDAKLGIFRAFGSSASSSVTI